MTRNHGWSCDRQWWSLKPSLLSLQRMKHSQKHPKYENNVIMVPFPMTASGPAWPMIFLSLLLTSHHCAAFAVRCLREHLRFKFENEIHKIRYLPYIYFFSFSSSKLTSNKGLWTVRSLSLLTFSEGLAKFSVLEQRKWLPVPFFFAKLWFFSWSSPWNEELVWVSLMSWVSES